MDMRTWKKVLMQWITECGFTTSNYFNIEQTDIDAFYKKICERHQVSSSPKTAHANNLIDFLDGHYPECELRLDDENSLSTNDYVYAYSLMLHYSCVKYPQPYFHDICKKLSMQCQQYIANFFKELLECPSITKMSIRHAAVECSQQTNESAGSGGDLATSSMSRSDLSPNKTPNRTSNINLRISPSTPKTFLLEERTRELYNLRAQLETERYEKGLLEVQIKQNEDKMNKINQDHKKLLQQIHDLKNDILSRSAEGEPSYTNSEDQLKRRLCKEITQKEQEIMKLNDENDTLKEEKNLLQEKLVYAEKQIIVCMERIKELDYKVDELTAELEHKNDTIKYLHEHKLELERFISETRSASKASKPDFNASAECLDMSYSTNTNSSTSTNSPENLGCSVVDVQLREKEIENLQLKEQLGALRFNNTRLAKLIQQLSFKLSQEYHIHFESIAVNEEGVVDPAEHFLVYADCADKLGKYYKNERNRAKKLQEDMQMATQRNTDLTMRVDQCTLEMKSVRQTSERIESMNEELERNRKEMMEKLKQFEMETKTLTEQKFRLVTQLDTLSNEYDQYKDNCKAHQLDYTLLIEKLQAEVITRNKDNMEITKTNVEITKCNEKFKDELKMMQEKIDSLQNKYSEKIESYESELKTLNDRLIKQMDEVQDHQTASQKVKEQYEKLLIQHEAMKRKTRESDDHLDVMRNHLAVKELEMSKLGNEIDEVRKLNAVLEDRINELMSQYKIEKQNSDLTINMRDECIKKMTAELKKLNDELGKITQKQKESQAELEITFLKVEGIYKLLEDNVAAEPNKPSIILEHLSEKVKALIEYKMDSKLKIECLEFNNVESMTKIQHLQEQMENAEQKIAECALKIEEKNICLEKIGKELNAKENDLAQAKNDYENDLQSGQERFGNKERELMVVIGEHNDTKKQLEQLHHEYMTLRNRYTEKIKNLELKVDKWTLDNQKYVVDMKNFKLEHKTTEHRMKETDEAFNELADQLHEQNACRDELRMKLKTSEEQLTGVELKLENVMKDNFQAMHELQMAFEKQVKKVRALEDQLIVLENAKSEQADTITDMKEKLQKTREDRERLMSESSEISLQIQREQSEKTTLLHSLEKTADQLKKVIDDKSHQTHKLENQCASLEEKIKELNQKNIQLETELATKSTELCVNVDEHQQERDNWQSKISELMRKMTEQSIELEAYDISIIEIMAMLDNTANQFAIENPQHEIKNMFNVEESQSDTIINQLKKTLNRLMFNVTQLQAEFAGGELKLKQLSDDIDLIKLEKSNLSDELKSHKMEIAELQEMLAGEAKAIEAQYGREVERMLSDVHNLEEVKAKLSEENEMLKLKLTNVGEELENTNFTVNLLTDTKMRLIEEQKAKTQIIEKLKHEEHTLNECLKDKQSAMEKVQENLAQLQKQMKQKATKFNSLEKEYRLTHDKLCNAENKLEQYEKQCILLQNELKEVTEKSRTQDMAYQSLDNELALRRKEILNLQHKVTDLSETRLHLENQLDGTTKKIDDYIAAKLTSESKYEQLNSQFQQLIRDHDVAKLQLQSTLADVERLSAEIDTHKAKKQQLNDELKDCKRELQRANDNVTQLIQQIGSIRLEKESVVDENQLLRKQLDENSKYQSTSETKLKSIVESSQTFERKLLTTENELKSLRSFLEKSESNLEKTSAENKKLRDTQDANNKRIEKLALKLGDSQARCSKLDRDNEKLTKLSEAKGASANALQKDKDLLQSEVKVLKERLSKSERAHDQLSVKVQCLEKANATLEEAKQKLEITDIDSKSKITKLEKMRDSNEEKLRKLNSALNNTEQANVRLNLEIGALNSKLQEVKRTANVEFNNQLEELNQYLKETSERATQFETLSNKLETEVKDLQEQNVDISDQLSKVSLALQLSKEKCETLSQEMDMLRAELGEIREEKLKVEQDHARTCDKLRDFSELNVQLNSDKEELVTALEAKIMRLECEIVEKDGELIDLRNELSDLKSQTPEVNVEDIVAAATATAVATTAAATTEIDELRTRLTVAEEMLDKEQDVAAQLRLDNQILQAKYRESKQRILDETKTSEERIKENRLELEGKLEKMKNKMKTLYTEEITKVKAKHERETSCLRSELETLKEQNTKYDEHTRKLSLQIVRLNDRILEQQKQNTLLSTKLKHLEDYEVQQFKRPFSSLPRGSSTRGSSVTTISTAPSTTAMEDEEGEMFNNTYLADLKCGRMTDAMGKDICAEELQYRNSLLPPHLKSTYAAQYDHDLTEDELKDGPYTHNLDDSLSVLLSSTGGVARKKMSGATHYKRPGPPTPSKNGGRLSFGGNGEPSREILKESYDGNAASSSSSVKTPARFGFFSSRFSMGHSKDELLRAAADSLTQQQRQLLLRLAATGGAAVCTSTPRKKELHWETLHLLEHWLRCGTLKATTTTTTPVVCALSLTPLMPPPPLDVSIIETPSKPKCSLRQQNLTCRLQNMQPKSAPIATPPVETGATTPPQHSSAAFKASLQRCLRRRRRRRRAREVRPSLNLHGNIFAVHRTPVLPNSVLRELKRRKAKKQRTDLYNQFRMLPEREQSDEGTSLGSTHELQACDESADNNNNSDRVVAVAAAAVPELGDSRHFKQLLVETASDFPFAVQPKQYNWSARSSGSTATTATNSSSNTSVNLLKQDQQQQQLEGQSEQQQLVHTAEASTTHLSHIIYGSSIIHNRRLPHVNTTYVRNSSIYVKNKHVGAAGVDDVILVTNQTITLFDLLRMWRQMDNGARALFIWPLCACTLSIGAALLQFLNFL